jgi:hypothetical protein
VQGDVTSELQPRTHDVPVFTLDKLSNLHTFGTGRKESHGKEDQLSELQPFSEIY